MERNARLLERYGRMETLEKAGEVTVKAVACPSMAKAPRTCCRYGPLPAAGGKSSRAGCPHDASVCVRLRR